MKNDKFFPDSYKAPECPILDKYEQEERGNRSHYVRVNVMMSPEMLAHLKIVGAELEALGRSDTDVSSLVRSSCKEFLSRVDEYFHEVKHNKWVDRMTDNQ